MKKVIVCIISICLIVFLIIKNDSITDKIKDTISSTPRLVIKNANEYEKKYDFLFVQRDENFVPYSYGDLLNIIYSILNKGYNEFTFYCPYEYSECKNDILKIINDEILLAHINNYVHPYNSYSSIKGVIKENGEVNVITNPLYSDEDITVINEKVDKIISENYKENDTDYNNLKRIHDNIIDNTKYDVERNENGESKYRSYMAIGPSENGYATCNGYADYLAIILSKLGYENYKVATTSNELKNKDVGHIWNAVKVDNEYLHIDLTWDDPVSEDGKDYLYHKYFLVDNKGLEKADEGDVEVEEHNFNKSIYRELK